MKKQFRFLKALAATALLIIVGAAPALAQCAGFAKKSAALLNPYDMEGKVHKVTLQSGDHAELSLTFMAGQSYRIVMNSSDAANGVVFILKDAEKKLVYSSASNPGSDYYDFVSEKTQPFTVEMIAKEKVLDQNTSASNCVSVMVGCMEDLGIASSE